jgi:glyoxylase-like metal-dependent hydrolase (beta-lactamase superfamily II)
MTDEPESMIVESLTVGPIQTSIFLVGCAETGEAVVVDGGGDTERILQTAEEHDLQIQAIWQTHAHIDHVAGLPSLKARTDVPILLHRDDHELYRAAPQQGQMFGFEVEPLPEPDRWIEEGDRLQVGELEAEVLLLPGHSPGHVAFYFKEQSIIFSGDVLFRGSIGRVDLPGCDPDAMKASLERMSKLPDETRVMCGHGPNTTIGREKESNPYLNGRW